MSAPILKLHIDERDNISVRVSQDVQVLTCEEANRIEDEYKRMQAENAKLRELATYALKHIIEFECEVPDREILRGKPCEDCADYGSSDCPKCMPRMFDVSGIEVDE